MLNPTKQAFYIFVSLLFFMPKLIKQNTFVNGEEIHLECNASIMLGMTVVTLSQSEGKGFI